GGLGDVVVDGEAEARLARAALALVDPAQLVAAVGHGAEAVVRGRDDVLEAAEQDVRGQGGRPGVALPGRGELAHAQDRGGPVGELPVRLEDTGERPTATAQPLDRVLRAAGLL